MADYKTPQQIFSDTLSKMMAEEGLGNDKVAIALCTAQFDLIWADYMQWLYFGEDTKAKTRDVIRASLNVASMWR